MNKKILSIAAAAVLGVLGTAALVVYVRGAEDRALAGERLVTVLVAGEEIPAGTAASALGDYVDTEQLPAKVVAEGAVDDLADLKGLVTSTRLLAGDVLNAGRFAETVDNESTSAVSIPADMQQLTLALSPEQTVGGVIRPGDTVAVVATFAVPEQPANTTGFLLQKVLVTNVQGAQVISPTVAAVAPEERTETPGGTMLVTFALSGTDVERVVYADSFGELHLSLQPAEGPESSQRQTAQTVFG